PGLERRTAGTRAVSCTALTKVVCNGLEFHFTTAPETKLLPLIVRVKAAPPGATAEGTRGCCTKGAGLAANPDAASRNKQLRARKIIDDMLRELAIHGEPEKV